MKTKALVITIIAILLVGGGAGAYLLLKGNDDVGVMETVKTDEGIKIEEKNSKLEEENKELEKKIKELQLQLENAKEENTKIKDEKVSVNDMIVLGYDQVAIVMNGKAYVIPVYDRDNNFSEYQLYEVKGFNGKVKLVRQYCLGLDVSETNFFVMEDGSVYTVEGIGKSSTAKKILNSSENIIDIVEEDKIIYAVSQSGKKTKIAQKLD